MELTIWKLSTVAAIKTNQLYKKQLSDSLSYKYTVSK
jgi:hypothetical protein